MDNGNMTEDTYRLKQGTMLENRYRINRVIGEGGFGITYEAVNTKIDMTVAIKEFFCREYIHRNVTESNQIKITYAATQEPFERAKNRFLQEAKTLSGLSDENAIVKILDYFEENGTAYIVMNFLQGIPLDQYIRKNGPMKWTEMIEKIKPLLETLEHMHNRGVIHRDISPSNIMVLSDGKLCLLDFGAAKDIIKKEKTTSIVFTKQGYTPIEQYANHGNVGAWSDVYALSAVCYECLTGKCPPDALQRSVFDEYRTLKQCGIEAPDELEMVLKKGLAVRKENRFLNMRELLKAFVHVEEKKSKARKWVVATIVPLLLLLITGVGFSVFYREEILFRFEETESFYVVRDEGISLEDFTEDFNRIEQRIQKLVGNEHYIWQKKENGVRGVIPLKCFGKENPREIIQWLLIRPNKWTICGIELKDEYISSIGFQDREKKKLEIKLTEKTPKDIRDTLASLCEDRAVLSVDYGFSNQLQLNGQRNNLLSYTWDLGEVWEEKAIRELFLYNITQKELKGTFSIYTQIQSIWETRRNDIEKEFGKKQCEIEELSDNKIILEYCSSVKDNFLEGDMENFISLLKKRLDILDISYAIGRAYHDKRDVTLCVNQKDYNPDLFYLLLKEDTDLNLRDAWGQEIVGISSMGKLQWENEKLKLSVNPDDFGIKESIQNIQKATQVMAKKGITQYYLTVQDICLLEGTLEKQGKKLIPIDNGVLFFDSIDMDGGKLNQKNKKIVNLLNEILSAQYTGNNYELSGWQYMDKNNLVADEPVEVRSDMSFDTSEENRIVEKIKNFSDKYDVKSVINHESGEELLIIHLSDQIYSESVMKHEVLLQQIEQIMKICNLPHGTPWENITVGINDRYEKGSYAGKIMFSHNIYFDKPADCAYYISIVGFKKEETQWLKHICEEMKKDQRFQRYKIEFTDYSDYYIY